MLLGLAFSVLAFGAGWLVLHLLGLNKGFTSTGLAPAVGLAILAVVTVARAAAGLPPAVGTMFLLGSGGIGVALAVHDGWTAAPYALRQHEHRSTFALLGCALVIPVFISGFGLHGIEVPLSTHDGAYHVEVIQALQNGASLPSWYPPGLHATIAALLGAVPWVDSARGTFEAALALMYLAPLAVFGLGCASWRNPLIAAAGALLIAITFEYPFYPQFWAGWPLAMALVLVWGLWTCAMLYVERPRAKLAICVAILAAGIVITHGSEIYTVLVGLVLLTVAAWRRVPWRALAYHIPLAVVVALLLAIPYLPILLGWASVGGAVGTGYALLERGAVVLDSAPVQTFAGVPEATWALWANTIGSGLEFDAPPRLALVVLGAGVAIKARQATLLVGLLLTFVAIGVVLRLSSLPVVVQAFALTFPWGLDYRLAMVQAVAAALLGGGGVVASGRWLAGLPQRFPSLLGVGHDVARRRASACCKIGSTALVVGTVTGLAFLCAAVAAGFNSYTADDAAAMDWLHRHAETGDVVANDASTDGGIWAPYKAGTLILTPQATSMATDDVGRAMLRDLGRLNSADSQAFACAHHVRYLYHGAKQTGWERTRYFPSIDALANTAAFEEVFRNGQAAVFRLRVDCA
jgi:hypothetical protein